ncbi:protein of unknown function [uncultured Sphingopyxis sp.]|uniref:Uncharacterized protein n=1 Tax=uncultured Sphingopyxis sp. TaxID=310581 RepID=A0A1Y5PWF1_9SPHN|nr:protein of unknown function [uncultured Sphingopyxis sp.]
MRRLTPLWVPAFAGMTKMGACQLLTPKLSLASESQRPGLVSKTRAPVTNTRHPPCAQAGEGPALPGAGPLGRVEPEAVG